jgi:hypothetical protein
MNRRITGIVVAALWLLLAISAQPAEIGPRRITLPTENLAKEGYLTVPGGSWVFALSYEYEILEDAFTGNETTYNSANTFTQNNTLALDLTYGLSDNITLNAIIPYKYVYNTREVDSSLESGTEGIIFTDRRGSQGLGDIILMSYLRLNFGEILRFGDEYYPTGDDGYDEYIDEVPRMYAGKRQGAVLALALGLRLPTGNTDVIDKNGNRLEDDLQLGTGTMDPIFGLLYHQRYFRLGWGISGLYRISSQENIYHYEFGNEAIAAAYIGYRLNRSLEWVNQLNGNWLERDMLRGQTTLNRGGSVLFYTPSLIYTGAGNVTFQASAEVPVSRNFNEQQLSSDYIINIRTALMFD